MTAYVKTLSKRNEGSDKEKTLPVAYLGSSMVNHGEDFENDSEFGQCLISALNEGLTCFDANLKQTWGEQMSELHGYRKHMLQMRLQAGLNR